MQFENAYSMPQCTPTRVTLLTGQYPFRHGWINHWDVPRWGAGCHFDAKHNLSFARLLKSAGYATAAAGKWQVNDFRVEPEAMVKHGFDEYCMWTGGETGNPPSDKRYRDPYIHTKDGSRTYTGEFGPDVFTDFLIDFMRRNKAKPMLMYYPMVLTHTPFTTTPHKPKATGKIERHKAMVDYVDHLTGKLVNVLDELNIRDNTIIFWTTDNGTSRSLIGHIEGTAVKGGKAYLGENGTNMPFIVNCPGLVPGGIKTDALTDFTDMLPTIAELAGAELPKDVIPDGHSIAELILGRTSESDRQWILSMGGHPAKIGPDGRVINVKDYANRAIRDKRYKLWIENSKPSKFFDLTNDPYEKENLIESKDPVIVEARRVLESVIRSLPSKDGNPIYDANPPQAWDMKASGLIPKSGERTC
jgi:arylsulfatase A-like enzyme